MYFSKVRNPPNSGTFVRYRTPSRAERDREAKPYRDEMLRRIPVCEVCQSQPSEDVHEIMRGNADRMKAQDKPYATLAVCRIPCHEELGDASEWPEARQLALLKQRRPDDYDLAAYNKLKGYGSDRITEEDVAEYETPGAWW